MSPKILVVVGATGGQGSGVIHHFQHHYSHIKLRGLTRTPTSPAALSLAKTGVEMIQADLNDLASLKQAFKSANYIFAYTDFGSIISSPAVMGRFTAGDLVPPIGAESYKIEVQQGRNIADAAAGVPELERLVWSGLADVRKWSAGKYTRVFHFDAKAAVTAYTFGHEGLRGKVRCVQMGAFLGNFVKGLEMFGFSVGDDGQGGKSAVWRSPFPSRLPLPWVDVEKDTGAFVKALIDVPTPTQVLAVSEWMSSTAWLELWSKTTGIKSRYEEVGEKESTSDDPSGVKLQFYQSARFLTEFGFTGGDPELLLPEDLEKEGFAVPRTRVEDYVEREDWSRIIG